MLKECHKMLVNKRKKNQSLCVVTIGIWIRRVRLIATKKNRRKWRPKGNTKSTQQRGAGGDVFCWSWEGIPIVDLSLGCCCCVDCDVNSDATSPRLTDQVYKTLGQNASDAQLLGQRCTRKRRVSHQNKNNLKYTYSRSGQGTAAEERHMRGI